MKKLLTLFILLLLFSSLLNAQSNVVYQWAYGLGGSGGAGSNMGKGIATDGSGNVYVTGYFMNSFDFDPGPGVTTLTANGATNDIFFSKFDAAGNLLWAKSIGGNGQDYAYGLAVDGSGNFYITGNINSTPSVDFDPSAGIANFNSSGLDISFVAKYDANGNFVWVKGNTNSSTSYGRGVGVDASGNVYFTGHFNGTANFGGAPLTSSSYDISIVKYSASGTYLWSKQIGGTGSDMSNGTVIDAAGAMIITGSFDATATFNTGPLVTLTPMGTSDIFLAKYDQNGTYVWANQMGGAGCSSVGQSVCLDGAGNIGWAGYIQNGTADFDPSPGTAILTPAGGGGTDIAVAKYDFNGNYLWAHNFGNTGYDAAYAVTSDPGDATHSLILSGYLAGTADMDPSAAVANASAAGGSTDAIIARYDDTGNYVWAACLGGLSSEQAHAVCASGGKVLTTGWFQGTADFDPSAATVNFTSVGTNSIFIATYTQCTSPAAPGIISGPTAVCPGQAGVVYNIPPVPGATSYSWGTPPGATITAGLGTNSITVTFASSPGNVTVSALNACGSTGPSTLAITLNPGTPAVPTTIFGAASYCSPSSPSYNISPVAGATTYTWSVVTPASGTIMVGQGTINVTVNITGAPSQICVTAGNSCGTSLSRCLTLSPNAPTNITTQPLNQTSCTGANASFTVGATGTALTYQWQEKVGVSSFTNITNGGIYSGATSNILTLTGVSAVMSTNQYQVLVTGTCPPTQASTAAVLTIIPNPTVNAGADQFACANNSVISLNGSIGGSATGGTWSTSGSGTFGNANALNTTYTPSAADKSSGTVTLILSATGSPCGSPTDAMVLTITPAPTVNAGTDQSRCAGSPVSLTGNVTIATGGIWSTSGTGTFSPSATTLNPVYTPSPADISAGTVTLTLTSTGNGTCTAQNDQMIITILPVPTANPGSSQNICAGGSTVLSGSGSGGTAPYSYLWTPASGLSSTTVANPTASPAGTTTYSLIVTGSNGCQSSNIANATITVNANPVSPGYSGTTTICNNTSTTITASGTGPGYGWYNVPSLGAPLATTAAFTTPLLVSNTTYYVENISAAGCSSARTAVPITVNGGVAIPDANFVTWLQATYPGCMCGNIMDITCPSITSATLVNVAGLLISDLSGIEYFTSVQLLQCNNNSLTSLPSLPASLQILYCNSNSLTSLPSLPTGLQTINCSSNSLTSLPGLPSGLTDLECATNSLTSLPILPTSLTNLLCNNNSLTSLPILPASLQVLTCHSNSLTSLPSLPAGLTQLYCGFNSLTSLPGLPSGLTDLNCTGNSLTILPNLSTTSLINLYCLNNSLTGALPTLPNTLCNLNAAGNPGLCYPNTPTCPTFTADISLCAVPSITSFTPSSTCVGSVVSITGTNFTGASAVQINGVNAPVFTVVSATQIDITVPAGASSGLIDVTTPGGTGTSATSLTIITGFTVPDANFVSWLTANYPGCMCGNTMDISCGAITSETAVNVSGLAISDLTGIQYFTSLQLLFCNNNSLASLPSLPTSLQTLSCLNNSLTSLPTLPSGLSSLVCHTNSLTTLPALPASLTYLDCSINSITALPALPGGLTYINCSLNSLPFLPAPLPASLMNLYCGGNSLTAVPALPAGLVTLDCNTNSLGTLPALPAGLISLNTSFNSLSSLASLPTGLQDLDVRSNTLTTIPTLPNSVCNLLAIGNGAGICYPNTPTCGTFTADIPLCAAAPAITSFSPASACTGSVVSLTGTIFTGATAVQINGVNAPVFTVVSATQIDVTVPAGASSGLIDVTTPGGTGTSATSLTIITGFTVPDANFVSWLTANYPGCMCGNTMDISCPGITSATIVNVSSQSISDLSGIQYFTSLQNLDCSANSLSGLPGLPASLQQLLCSTNSLTSLPVLPTGLTDLTCGMNSLTSLPGLPASLTSLDVSNNSLTSLPGLPAGLTQVICAGNSLTSLPGLPAALVNLDCQNNSLTSLPALPGTLTQLDLSGNSVSTLPSLPAGLTDLGCTFNSLSSLPTLPNSLCNLSATGNNAGLCYPNTPTCGTFSADIPACSTSPSITSFNPTSACVGSVVSLTGNAFTGATSVNINGVNAPAFTVVNATQIDVTVPAGAASGLIDVTTAGGTGTSASSITINAGPNTALTISPSADTVCFGMNDTITVNSSEIGVTYTPMKGATAVGGAVSGTGGNIDLIISSAGLSVGGNIISIQASNGSCPAINLTSNSSLTYDNSTVSTAFTTGNQICGTNPVVVSVPAVNNSYQWFLNGSKIIGATAPTYGVVAPGNYLAQVVNSFGCAISTGPMFIGAITPPVIIPSGGAGNDTLLSVSVPGATSYQWYAYGGQKAIVGETGSSYRPYFLSDYMIGANINGCRILSNPYTLNNSSMSMLTRQNFMMTDSTIYISGPAVASAIADIYPNPSFGKFTLNYQCHSSKEVEIKVFNAVGLLIAEKNFASHSGIISANFDEFNFKPGMYMISITEDNEKSEVRRLMIY